MKKYVQDITKNQDEITFQMLENGGAYPNGGSEFNLQNDWRGANVLFAKLKNHYV